MTRHVLVGGAWTEGHLDPTPGPEDVVVRVHGMRNVQELSDLYIQRANNPWTLLNFAREAGIRVTARKVLNRLSERSRDDKHLSVGVGVTTDGPVRFIAPRHPRCTDRLVLHRSLVQPYRGELPDGVRHVEMPFPSAAWDTVAGWSPFSDRPLDPTDAWEVARKVLQTTDWSQGTAYPTTADLRVVTTSGPPRPKGHKPRAAVFGYGQYARVVLIPSLSPSIDIAKVHEVDPMLVRPDHPFDTAPMPGTEPFDVYCAAGFHHTHAPIGVYALERGAAALLEKPVAVDREQLGALAAALRGGGQLFLGYHRRYHPFNDLLAKDLEGPMSMHAVVFEEALPKGHWYKWPSSKTRVISNGCHWIDWFLHLHPGVPVSKVDAAGTSDTANITVQLDNGAMLTLALTDHGSPRLGMRESVQFRAGKRTAYIEDGLRYQVEDENRIRRRAKATRMEPYTAMYRTIGARIAAGATGETVDTLVRSASAVLDADEALKAR